MHKFVVLKKFLSNQLAIFKKKKRAKLINNRFFTERLETGQFITSARLEFKWCFKESAKRSQEYNIVKELVLKDQDSWVISVIMIK